MVKKTDLKAQGFKGLGVSPDGSSIRIYFAAEQGEGFHLTLPSESVAEFHRVLTEVHEAIKARQPGEPLLPQAIGKWKVGASNLEHLKKFTALLFDEGTPKQALFMLADIDALKLADAIEQKVFTGMSVDDQRKMIKDVESHRSAKPRLILPGRLN